MESSILDRDHRYDMINQKRSFSFQKSRIGKGYIFKIAFLLLITAILSWYSRQDSNNPFSIKSRIDVIYRNGNMQFEYIQGHRGKKISTIVAPGRKLLCDGKNRKDNSWDLLSTHIFIDSSCLGSSPRTWNIIDTSIDTTIEIPAGWPRPIINKDVSSDFCSAGFITPFADSRTALLIKFKSISCLIADGSDFNCSQNENTLYKEKFELIAATNSSPELIVALRSCFRPRYILILDRCPGDISGLKNVLCMNGNPARVSFTLTRHNTLKAE